MTREEILQQTLEVTPKNANGTWIISPRVGKTRIAIEYIKKHNFDTILWVTVSKDLIKDIEAEFTKWGAEEYFNRMHIVLWSSLKDYEGFYDFVLLDEYQNVTANNIEVIWNENIAYNSLIAMTGTKPKNYEKNLLLRSLNLVNYITVTTDDAVENEIVSDYEITVYNVPLSKEMNIEVKLPNGTSFKTSECKQYLSVHNKAEKAIYTRTKNVAKYVMYRLRAIYDSKSKEKYAKLIFDSLEGRTIIFCPTVQVAERISKHFYHNKSDKKALEDFQEEKIDKIALVNKGGTGYTFKNVKNVVLIQVDSDKTGLTTQKIFRALLKENFKKHIHILQLEGTKDVEWVKSCLQNFNENKVKYVNIKQ